MLTDSELWQAMREAETRKLDKELPIDVRIRSAETFSLCLSEADARGFTYGTLRAKVAQYGG